jgi:hypothetical protein
MSAPPLHDESAEFPESTGPRHGPGRAHAYNLLEGETNPGRTARRINYRGVEIISRNTGTSRSSVLEGDVPVCGGGARGESISRRY